MMNLCRSFWLNIVLFFYVSEGTDKKTIWLSDSNDNTGIFYLNQNDSLQIFFENVNASSISCRDKNNSTGFYITGPINTQDEHTRLNVPNIINGVFTRWRCEILNNFHEGATDKIYYEFDVQNIKINVSVKIGDCSMPFNETYPPTYKAKFGEVIDWSCSRIHKKRENFIMLKYYNAQGILLAKSEQSSILRLRKRFTQQDRFSYVDCIFIPGYNDDTNNFEENFTYRTVFEMDTETTDLDKIKITHNTPHCENVYRKNANTTSYFKKMHNPDPIVLGLRDEDIIYQYTSDPKTWVTHYQHPADEVLNLTCARNDDKEKGNLKWLDGSTDKSEEINSINDNGETSNINITPKNFKAIMCVYSNSGNRDKKMIIKFQEKPLQPPSKDGSSPVSMNIVYVSGALLVILIITICVFSWYFKLRKKEHPFQNFTDLTEFTDSTIVMFPNQWDGNEYSYVLNSYSSTISGVMLENSMYRQNQPRVSSVHTENHYTEIDDSFINHQRQTSSFIPTSYENHQIKNDISDGCYSNVQREISHPNYENSPGNLGKIIYSNPVKKY